MSEWVEVNPERLELLRRAIGRAFAIADQWVEASIARGEAAEVREAFHELFQYLLGAQGHAFMLTYRDPEPGVFESLLATPGEQFDREGVVVSSVLVAQRLADLHAPSRCPHRNTATHPPGTIGGSPVTVCNDCGVYL